MSIALGVVTLLSTGLHQLPHEGEYDNSPQRNWIYGVRGTLEIGDERHGRPISIDVTFSQYATELLLATAKETLDAYVPALADKTLVVVCGMSTLTYVHVTFDGLERMENPRGEKGPWYDGSGVNGWMENLCLHFWQSDSTP